MSTDGRSSQFSPEMTEIINDAYQDAAAMLDVLTAHGDRRAALAKAVIDLAREGVLDKATLRDRAVAAVNRLDWIRCQAHEIWESQGRPPGRHGEHWAQAEGEWAAQAAQGI